MTKVEKKQNKFTAKVVIPNQSQPRYIPNAIVYKGKIVQLVSVGVGIPIEKGCINSEGEGETWEEFSSYTDEMRPYLSKVLMGSKVQYFQSLLKISDNLLTPKNEEELLSVSFQMGENSGGYFVSNVEEDAKKKEAEELLKVEKREVPLTLRDSYFGLTIEQRLPKNIWESIKPHAKYWSEHDIDEWFDDMDDYFRVGEGRYMKGWYYTKDIVPILEKLNFTLIIND